MKHKNKISMTSVIVASLFFTVTSCKKFLEIPPPKTQLETSSTFGSSSTANAAALGIYSKMINDFGLPYKVSSLTGISADELKNYSTQADIVTFYTNNLNSQNSYLYNPFWQAQYSYIFAANSIIEGVANSSALTESLKNQLTGEAKFIRAFCYFNLVNLFGDVPLVTATNYKTNGVAAKVPASDIYQQIISDLKDAEGLLNSNFVGVDGVTQSVERVRPNKWSATALLSRTYLYTNDWVKAETESNSVISNTMFKLPILDSVFLKNNTEVIWSLQSNPAAPFSTPEGVNYILTSAPTTSSSQNATISSNLLSAFELNDNRKTKWIGSFNTYQFPNKYKQQSGSSFKEYSVALRLAEQYLIRAEAKAQQNRIAEGLQDVNKIRNRAGLSDTTTTSKTQLLDIILHERQVELFCEYGHRWFDLKRTGKIDQVMTTVTPQKGGTWAPYKALFPVPLQELNSDPNLKQNDGYQ